MQEYYCPYCGRTFNALIFNQNLSACPSCLTKDVEFQPLQHDSSWYRDRSEEEFGNIFHSWKYVMDEVRNNPLFDPDKAEATRKQETELLERVAAVQRNISRPQCPTCGSKNVKSISDTKKVLHAVAFGLFSKTATSQFECLNCHYKW